MNKIKKRWSMMIIILFILFLIAFIWLLITKYVINIVEYSSEYYKYYRAYYLANAWIELSLTKIKHRWFGFEDSVLSGSTTNSSNLICNNENCFFEYKIYARSHILWQDKYSYKESVCSSGVSYVFKSWQGLIIPLFYDQGAPESRLDFSTNISHVLGLNLQTTSLYYYNSSWVKYAIWISMDKPLTMGKLESNIITNTRFVNNFNFNLKTEFVDNWWDYYETYKSYLLISNTSTWTNTQSVCIDSPNERLPTTSIVVESLWRYRDRVVTIEAVKQSRLPDYLLYDLINK